MKACRFKLMKNPQRNADHMTKMAAMPISGKGHFKIFFPGTTGPILIKLCLKHQRPMPFIFRSNYYPRLTLTYFMARTNFVT